MNQEQKNGDIPPAYFVSTSQVSEKKRQYKKYAIIAGSAVLVVAMILITILVGLYFFSETQKEIVKFAFTRGDNSKEEVTSDPNTNVVQYHVNSDQYELWAYNDFNRDIQVLKIQSDIGTNCYVTPLNRTIADDPSKIVAPAGVNPIVPNKTYHLTYRAANQPIPDSTFLCKQARDVCEGISTYWMFPTCYNSTSIATAMEKRKKRDFFFFFTIVVSIAAIALGGSVEVQVSVPGKNCQNSGGSQLCMDANIKISGR